MTVWRDMDEAAQALARRRQWKKVRVLGLDGLYPLEWGKKRPVIVAVDLGDGQAVAIGNVECAHVGRLRNEHLIAKRD
jgi:hypothetical protein